MHRLLWVIKDNVHYHSVCVAFCLFVWLLGFTELNVTQRAEHESDLSALSLGVQSSRS